MKSKTTSKTSKIFFFVIISFIFYNSAFSQVTSSLMIKDLMIIENNPLQQDDSSKVKYTIFFKISEIANAKAVHISLGTEQDVGDVLQIEAMYKLQNGNYFLNYNSKSYAYSNYTSYLEITLLKQNLSNMKYLTLYIDDNDGNVTQKYYCNVKP